MSTVARSHAVWLSAIGVLTATLLARGCGSDSDAGAPIDGVDGGTASDAEQDADQYAVPQDRHEASIEADAADTGQPECPKQPMSPDVPEGWEEYPVMDCKYRLYVPSTQDLLPPPLTWEPCTQDLGPDSLDCRQIKVDWPTELDAPYAIGGEAPAYVAPDGKVVIQLRKVHQREGATDRETAYMAMVVEADGQVRQAFWQDYHAGKFAPFLIGQRRIALGKSSWYITEWSGASIIRNVSIGGDDTLLKPPALLDVLADDPDPATVVAGTDYYVETGYNFHVRSWDGTDKGFAAKGAGAYSPPTWVGPTLLFAFESFPSYRIWRWTEQDGSKELVGFGADTSKGAGFPGSDGTDLVWIQGEDLGPNDTVFPSRSIMTSPFSTDPAKIQPRRLRAWEPDYVGTPVVAPVVGCGLAGFSYVFGSNDPSPEGVLVVRLADGVSWLLRRPSQLGWTVPIAITCDEVFSMSRGANGLDTIRRVRLDSLGPGDPPN